MNYLQKKKLAFMSIVNRVKGFVRTITGALPLTLEGCVDEESIIDYTIYGNSVQDGTPTPETPVEVESVGEYDETTGKYKIPIKVSGKNLFGNLQDKWVNTTGAITASQLGKVTQYIPCKSGDIFTISASFPTESSNNILVLSFRDVDNNNLGRYTVNKQKKLSLTKIAPTNTAYVVAGHYSNVPDWVMFEQNKTATDYEPYHEPITTNIYLDEPLRKVGDYADYVDLENGKVVRQITKVPKWLQTTNIVVNRNNNVCAFLGAPGARTIAKTLVYCPLFKKVEPEYGWNSSNENIMSHITTVDEYAYYHIKYERLGLAKENNTVYKINDETKTTLTDGEICALAREYFKSNFTEEECSIYVCDYQAPIEEDIDLPNIPTFKGTSIISADTTTQPSNVEIEYYSNVKE